jgi:CelD/BcsL family acetyltransferase involved in cellulose biosynthesis
MSTVSVYRISPLHDPRWTRLVERHPRASVFHIPGWLEALQRTYGYEPVVLTTSAPGTDLTNGIVFCQVNSWLTGRRLVSLPFSDHCEPLVESPRELEQLMLAVEEEARAGRWKYVEVRPLTVTADADARFEKAQTFCFHRLDLRPAGADLFRSFHKDCVQRKIRRAEREALRYEEGCSETLLQQFYALLVLTRRRQRLPPQPLSWFRNLIECMGDRLKIRVASKDGRPVASILTLRHNRTLVYKYGCSDKSFSNLGGMHLLFWRSIEEAKENGLLEMDMGRSDWDNPGLIDFKARWGAQQSELVYLRNSSARSQAEVGQTVLRVGKQIIDMAPESLAKLAGRVFYRHLG